MFLNCLNYCFLQSAKKEGEGGQIQKHWIKFAPTIIETRLKY